MPARSISASVPSTVSTATRLSCRLPTHTLASNTGTLGRKSRSTWPTLSSPSPQPSPVEGEGEKIILTQPSVAEGEGPCR